MSGAEETGQGTLIYAGVDEAGYGPLLGPLCVGMCVLRVDGFQPGGTTPDLWKALRPVVRREPSAKSTRWIAVNDSKRLKLANGSKTAHPLTHLERGVLAFARQIERMACADDASMFKSFGTDFGGSAWYAGDALTLPLTTTEDHLRLLSSRLGASLRERGVGVLDVRCAAVCEEAFNQRLREAGTKSRLSFDVVGSLLRRVWLSEAAGTCPTPARVVVDRQGGRTAYAQELCRVLPGADVQTVEESRRASVYDLRGQAGEGPAPGQRRMRVIFEVEAEARHFPVALASMIAKLVRELAMMRFNRYWSGRMAELKPTAGYRNDAWRWLEDARRLGAPEAELRLMCRDA